MKIHKQAVMWIDFSGLSYSHSQRLPEEVDRNRHTFPLASKNAGINLGIFTFKNEVSATANSSASA